MTMISSIATESTLVKHHPSNAIFKFLLHVPTRSVLESRIVLLYQKEVVLRVANLQTAVFTTVELKRGQNFSSH